MNKTKKKKKKKCSEEKEGRKEGWKGRGSNNNYLYIRVLLFSNNNYLYIRVLLFDRLRGTLCLSM